MSRITRGLASFCIAACALAGVGCCVARSDALPMVRGTVTDVAAFDAFIAARPAPKDFRARYPDVVLVLPGEMATKELRANRSRYFAELDGDGRITGGKFQ